MNLLKQAQSDSMRENQRLKQCDRSFVVSEEKKNKKKKTEAEILLSMTCLPFGCQKVQRVRKSFF